MEWYHIVIVVVSLLAAIYALICGLNAPKFLGQITTPKHKRSYEESRKLQIDQENWDFDEFDNIWDKHYFELTTFDDVKLHCLYVTNAQKSDKVAIICHGHISNLMQSVKYADIFYKRGYNVVLYDNRFFGISGGEFSTLGQNETRDLELVIDKTKEIFGQNAYIALHGESMGGATVLSVLKNKHADIKYVVADCPFSNTAKLFREMCHNRIHFPSFPLVDFVKILAWGKFKYDINGFNPKNVVKQADTPICFVHGTLDKLIDPHHSRDMFKLCKNPNSELHLIEGAYHARSHMAFKALYIKTVGDFIDKMEKLAKSE